MTAKAIVPASKPEKRLPAWTYEFAAWLASKPVKPTKAEQISWIEEFTQKGFTDYRLRQLHKNPEFERTLLKYELNHVERVKSKLLRKLDKFEERFDWAVDTAFEEGDYRTVGKLAAMPLENTVFQRKQAEGDRSPTVNITISEARITSLDAEVPTVEYEELDDGETEEDY